jgi:hypothetical protein
LLTFESPPSPFYSKDILLGTFFLASNLKRELKITKINAIAMIQENAQAKTHHTYICWFSITLLQEPLRNFARLVAALHKVPGMTRWKQQHRNEAKCCCYREIIYIRPILNNDAHTNEASQVSEISSRSKDINIFKNYFNSEISLICF